MKLLKAQNCLPKIEKLPDSQDLKGCFLVMQLSSKGRYAVMAMADLARLGIDTDLGQPVSIASVAQRQHISQTYLEQIFMQLRRAGLVQSSRGPGGGYILARGPKEISIFEIMEAVDEPVQMTRCSPEEMGGCVAGNPCLTHGLWQGLSEHIAQFLKSTSLQDVLVSPVREQMFDMSPQVDIQP